MWTNVLNSALYLRGTGLTPGWSTKTLSATRLRRKGRKKVKKERNKERKKERKKERERERERERKKK